MFLGEYQHSLDAKGRIILPSKFRAPLSDGCVVTRGQDQCLYVYPPDQWERVANRVREAPVTNEKARRARRAFFSGAHEQVPDRQGRVLIPEHLRSYAGLEPGTEASVIGNSDFFEIWERTRWEDYRPDAERMFSELAESAPELPL